MTSLTAASAAGDTFAPFEVVLVNPYEIGRQPFALAELTAWLKRDGFVVHCLDLSVQKLDPAVLARAGLVAIYVGMHTATRIAVGALPRIKELAPGAHLCVFGLYAPMNEAMLRELGVGTILGGELEPAMLSLCQDLRANGTVPAQSYPVVSLAKVDLVVPDRSGLPALERYAHLVLPDGGTRTTAFAEGSRGCKYLCSHCPVVPVYQGKFRIVPVDVAMADIRQQIAQGATHVSFGDPDFFNGPTHAMRLVQALHEEFPDVTFDATIKIQHIVEESQLLPELKRCGCVFITSAVEAVDDNILRLLVKNHTNADFARAVELTRAAGIALAPTFVAFTPWTTLAGYIAMLQRLVELRLVESVPPVQLIIRLLIPAGSYLLRIPGFGAMIQSFDSKMLGYPWAHPDARMDVLQQALQSRVMECETQSLPRREIFAEVWRLAHAAAGREAPVLPAELGAPIPHLSEAWYCCAEPTDQQLECF